MSNSVDEKVRITVEKKLNISFSVTDWEVVFDPVKFNTFDDHCVIQVYGGVGFQLRTFLISVMVVSGQLNAPGAVPLR